MSDEGASVGTVQPTSAEVHTFTASAAVEGGSASDYGASEVAALDAAFAAAAGVSFDAVSVTVVDRTDGGSGVEIVASVTAPSSTAAATASAAVDARLSTTAGASALLSPSISVEVAVAEGGVSVGEVAPTSGGSHAFTIDVPVEGGVASSYGVAERAALLAALADGAGVPLSSVSVVVVDRPSGGGVEIFATLALPSAPAAAAASAAVAAQLASPAAASALLTTSVAVAVEASPDVPASVGAVASSTVAAHSFATEVKVDGGSASEYGASEKAALAASFADGAGVALEDVSIRVVDLPEGGGVEIVATVAVLSEAAAATASAAIAEQLATPDAASALLSTSSSMRVSVDPAVPSSVGAVETTPATQHAFTTSVSLDGVSSAEYGATERS
ncbi:MAG: hypothetical protein VX563_05660, partial [Planctomycetota bacterium]|nr:hypothetical protein [Planctomycetota bacterium]